MLLRNHSQKFWRKIITEYTNDSYKEIQKDDWEGPIQTFYLENISEYLIGKMHLTSTRSKSFLFH